MNQNYFDEKQILERGKAYRNAFYTTLVLVASFGLFGFFYDGEISSAITTSILFAILFVSVTVFACTAIRLHAYYRFGYDTKSTLVWSVVMIVVALFLIAVNVYFGLDPNNDNFVIAVMQISVAISYIVTSTFYLVQKHIDKKKEKDE